MKSLLFLCTGNYYRSRYESEHRPLMLERFPYWESRTEYWQVGDIEVVPPKIALSSIDGQMDGLLDRLLRPLSDVK